MKFRTFIDELLKSPYAAFCKQCFTVYVLVCNLSSQSVYVFYCLYYGLQVSFQIRGFGIWLTFLGGTLLFCFFLLFLGLIMPIRNHLLWMIFWHFMQWGTFIFWLIIGGFLVRGQPYFIEFHFWATGLVICALISLQNSVLLLGIYLLPQDNWEELEKKYLRQIV